LRDGFSTSGTPGTGLGAIARLAASTDVYSRVPSGTALVARLWSATPPKARLHVGGVSVPKPGERVCGDAWEVVQTGARVLVMVADGLGHGQQAAEAAQTAARIFRQSVGLGPVAILQDAHAALRATRGAAVAVAEVDLDARALRYAGVGNIAGCVIADGASRSMVSHNGTLGHQAHKFQQFDYPFPEGALLVMHSDGVVSRWNLDPYPGLAQRDPALVAGVLYRDFQRGRDDVTVVAAREAGA
jgi:hypothetical protein